MMNQLKQLEEEAQTEPLADLPLTVEQADAAKAGTVLAGEGKLVKIDFCKTSY